MYQSENGIILYSLITNRFFIFQPSVSKLWTNETISFFKDKIWVDAAIKQNKLIKIGKL